MMLRTVLAFAVTMHLIRTGRASAQAAPTAASDTVVTLSLGDAARLASQRGGIAVIASHRAEQARARAVEVRSALLPHVSASYSDGQRTFNTASFGLSLPGFDPNGEVVGPVRTVDVRGRIVANLLDPAAIGRYRSAQAAAAGASATADAAGSEAAAVASAAYVRALRAHAQVAARAQDSTLAAELLSIAESQLRAGVGVALDVTRARAQVAATHAQLIAARNERDRAMLELARAIDLPSASIVLRDTLRADTDVTVPSERDVLAAAHQDRPDLRAAQAATEAARSAVRAARAERLPTVGVFADDGATSNSYTHLLNTYTYGFQVSLPLFEGLRTSARVRQQTAALAEAAARQHDVELQVGVDVRAALLDLTAGREQVDAARERLSLGEQELAQARERFRAGVAGNADVITAQLSLDAARSMYVDAVASLAMARVALERAQGHLLELP